VQTFPHAVEISYIVAVHDHFRSRLIHITTVIDSVETCRSLFPIGSA
jgi:hypothetical protein